MIPYLIVGVLGLLAAGAAISGILVWAPTGTDLKVHNAAGETALAGGVSGRLTQTTQRGRQQIAFTFQAPDQVTAHLVGPGVNHAPRSITGPTAQSFLSPVLELQTLTGFTGSGTLYSVSKTIKQLLTPAQRASVSGTFRTVATVTTGFVVRVQEHISATKGSQTVTEHVDYRLNRVDGWTRH